jgi:hypothetical protein
MNKKLVILFSVLLLGTALTGVTYAHWKKVITIDGSIDTGYFHVYPELYGIPPAGTYILDAGKYIAHWGEQVRCGKTDNWVKFQLFDIYPCLGVDGSLKVTNDGDIPAGLKSVTWKLWCRDKGSQDDWVLQDFEVVSVPYPDTSPYDGVPDQIELKFYRKDMPGANDTDKHVMTVHLYNLVGSLGPYPSPPAWPNSWIQIDPGCTVTLDWNLHFYEGLPQDKECYFVIYLEYWNWNEVPNLHDPVIYPD